MDAERFAHLRPFLYHVTARANLEPISRSMTLDPAAELMRRAGRSDLLRWKRASPTRLDVDGMSVVLSDQLAFAQERMSLYRGWSFEDYIEYMNELVFFWPGTSAGPAKTGVMTAALSELRSVILRIPTAEILDANPLAVPLFCGINVRAPRGEDARRVLRGPRLFTPADDFPRREAEVVEVAFRSRVALPVSAAFRRAEEWIPLAHAG